MTTIEALQAFYVAHGGQLEDVINITTIPEMIIALNSIIDPEQNTPITSEEIDEIINSIS